MEHKDQQRVVLRSINRKLWFTSHFINNFRPRSGRNWN